MIFWCIKNDSEIKVCKEGVGGKIMKFLFALTLAIGLSGCATSKYHKWETMNDSGFKETKISKGLYTVIYQGNGNNSPADVYTFFLKRASQLTKSKGYQFFRVENGQAGSRQNGPVNWPNYTGNIRFLKVKEQRTDFGINNSI